jgi:hypothetical protein
MLGMIDRWLQRKASARATEETVEARRDRICRERWAWEAEEGRRNEAEALERMRKAFEPLTDEERREITLRVAMDGKQRGNSNGTWTEQASRYQECADIARNLVKMRAALETTK